MIYVVVKRIGFYNGNLCYHKTRGTVFHDDPCLGYSSVKHFQGDYAACTEILNQARLRFPVSTAHAELWQSCQQRVAFTRAVLNRKLNEAEQILISLQAVDEPEAKVR